MTTIAKLTTLKSTLKSTSSAKSDSSSTSFADLLQQTSDSAKIDTQATADTNMVASHDELGISDDAKSYTVRTKAIDAEKADESPSDRLATRALVKRVG